MISFARRFLFVHVPKTGGNSVQNVLKTYSDDRIVSLAEYQDGVERFELRNLRHDSLTKHSTLPDYRAALDPDIYRGLFKFATIRNPWDRMISYYFSPHRGRERWSKREFIKLVERIPSARYFLMDRSLLEKISSRFSILDRCVFKPRALDREVDFLMKFETLEQDFKSVCRKLGLPLASLPRRNRSEREHYSKYYDEELKELVERKCWLEIAYGRYEFRETKEM